MVNTSDSDDDDPPPKPDKQKEREEKGKSKQKPSSTVKEPPPKKQKKQKKHRNSNSSDDDSDSDDDGDDEYDGKGLSTQLGHRPSVPPAKNVVDANDLVLEARAPPTTDTATKIVEGTVDTEALVKLRLIRRQQGKTETWCQVPSEAVVHFVGAQDDGSPGAAFPVTLEEFNKSKKDSDAFQQSLMATHAKEMIRLLIIIEPGSTEKSDLNTRQLEYCVPVELIPSDEGSKFTQAYLRDKIDVPLDECYTPLYPLGKECVKQLFGATGSPLPRALDPIKNKTIQLVQNGNGLVKAAKSFSPTWPVVLQGKMSTAKSSNDAAGDEDDGKPTQSNDAPLHDASTNGSAPAKSDASSKASSLLQVGKQTTLSNGTTAVVVTLPNTSFEMVKMGSTVTFLIG